MTQITFPDTTDLDVETMSPAEIDEILFPVWARRWQLAEWSHYYRQRVAASFLSAFGMRDFRRFDRSISPARGEYEMRDLVESLRKYDEERAEVDAFAAPFEAEYDRRPWVRYILCGNHNGHLHYRGCSTLRPTTEILLVAQASGLDSSEVVGKFGEVACTKCFPDAPVSTVKVDPNVCVGSGQPPVQGTHVARYRSAHGTCPTCETTQVVTSNYKIRKHNIKKES